MKLARPSARLQVPVERLFRSNLRMNYAEICQTDGAGAHGRPRGETDGKRITLLSQSLAISLSLYLFIYLSISSPPSLSHLFALLPASGRWPLDQPRITHMIISGPITAAEHMAQHNNGFPGSMERWGEEVFQYALRFSGYSSYTPSKG